MDILSVPILPTIVIYNISYFASLVIKKLRGKGKNLTVDKMILIGRVLAILT